MAPGMKLDTQEGEERNITYPLRLVLGPSSSNGDGILEHTIIFPKLQLFETGSSRKEVQNAAYKQFLVVVESHTRRGVDVCVFDLGGSCSN